MEVIVDSITNDEDNLIRQQEKWEAVIQKTLDTDTIAIDYLTDQLQFQFLYEHKIEFTNDDILIAVNTVIETLENITIPQIRRLLKNNNSLKNVASSNIPQYSNFALAVICVPEKLANSNTSFTYQELGYELLPDTKSDGSAYKFGENHGNLAMLVDLASITKKNNLKAFTTSVLTKKYCHLENKEKMELLQRLCFRIPIIQHSVVTPNPKKTVDTYLSQHLSQATISRRRSNVLDILDFALGD